MKKEFLEHLKNSPVVRYALKHLVDSNLQWHGHVYTDVNRGGKMLGMVDHGSNTFTTEGMNSLLNIMFGATGKTAAAGFYVGIFKNNVTPGLTDTAAAKLGAAGSYGECQDADYTPATNKPVYTIAAAAGGSVTNAAAAAAFTIANAGGLTVYGAFLSAGMPKTDTTGPLMCAKQFGAPRAVVLADVLTVTYVITCTTS